MRTIADDERQPNFRAKNFSIEEPEETSDVCSGLVDLMRRVDRRPSLGLNNN